MAKYMKVYFEQRRPRYYLTSKIVVACELFV